MADLRDKLTQRVAALMTQRENITRKYQGEINTIDTQLAACRDLAQNWDTYTITQALAVLVQTGVRLQLD